MRRMVSDEKLAVLNSLKKVGTKLEVKDETVFDEDVEIKGKFKVDDATVTSLALESLEDVNGETGEDGQFLKTDGDVCYWGNLPDLTAVTLVNSISIAAEGEQLFNINNLKNYTLISICIKFSGKSAQIITVPLLSINDSSTFVVCEDCTAFITLDPYDNPLSIVINNLSNGTAITGGSIVGIR